MTNEETLAAQRAYLETLTKEQRAAHNDYLIAELGFQEAAANYDYWTKRHDISLSLAGMSGSTFYEEEAAEFEKLADENDKNEDKYYDARAIALTRLGALAPAGTRFNDNTGRYETFAAQTKLQGLNFKLSATQQNMMDNLWNNIKIDYDNNQRVGTYAGINSGYEFWSSGFAPKSVLSKAQLDLLYPQQPQSRLDAAAILASNGPYFPNEGSPTVWDDVEKELNEYLDVPRPEDTKCECGAHASVGAERGGVGHSSWCPWVAK